jgi:DNA replication protein DnaC
MDTKAERKEIRTCERCGKNYEHEIVIIGDVEMFAGAPNECDPCGLAAQEDARETARIAQAQREFERIVPKIYRLTDIDHPKFNNHLHSRVQLWVKGAFTGYTRSWLGLVGETGRCKTRCLAMLAKRLIWNGHKLEWVTATGFQWAVQHQWGDRTDSLQATQWLKRWRSVEVLIFDDLGKQKMSESVESAFFDLIEHRSSHDLMTLWSANTHPNDMMTSKDLSKDRGAPIVGRLLDFSDIVNV